MYNIAFDEKQCGWVINRFELSNSVIETCRKNRPTIDPLLKTQFLFLSAFVIDTYKWKNAMHVDIIDIKV